MAHDRGIDVIQPFNSTDVTQWYRYALNNSPRPIPEEQLSSPFLHWINNTLVAAIAVLDGDPQTLSGGQIAGIVIGTVAGAIILAACIWYLLKRRQKIRVSTAVEAPEAEDLESK
jgi:hypothetical protein